MRPFAHRLRKGRRLFVSSTAADSVGSLGIMRPGAPACKQRRSPFGFKDGIISEILSLENADGGWSVSGSNSDIDVTAMALAALAPYKNGSAADAVERGLSFLSSKQLESGGFMSYGKENAESSAQVIVALTALGINPKTDGRFVKNGCSVFSALSGFRLPTEAFCHIKGGASNGTATVQAFYSLVALWRFENGLPSLFTLSVKGTKALPSSDSGKARRKAPVKITSTPNRRRPRRNFRHRGGEQRKRRRHFFRTRRVMSSQSRPKTRQFPRPTRNPKQFLLQRERKNRAKKAF